MEPRPSTHPSVAARLDRKLQMTRMSAGSWGISATSAASALVLGYFAAIVGAALGAIGLTGR
jgi:hypothetical protein